MKKSRHIVLSQIRSGANVEIRPAKKAWAPEKSAPGRTFLNGSTEKDRARSRLQAEKLHTRVTIASLGCFKISPLSS